MVKSLVQVLEGFSRVCRPRSLEAEPRSLEGARGPCVRRMLRAKRPAITLYDEDVVFLFLRGALVMNLLRAGPFRHPYAA